jgi:hypothetical protein
MSKMPPQGSYTIPQILNLFFGHNNKDTAFYRKCPKSCDMNFSDRDKFLYFLNSTVFNGRGEIDNFVYRYGTINIVNKTNLSKFD